MFQLLSFSKNFRQLGEKVEHFDETDQTRTSGFTMMLLLSLLLPLLAAFSIPNLIENKTRLFTFAENPQPIKLSLYKHFSNSGLDYTTLIRLAGQTVDLILESLKRKTSSPLFVCSMICGGTLWDYTKPIFLIFLMATLRPVGVERCAGRQIGEC